MSGEQILVLALLAAAFAAGWIARGAGSTERRVDDPEGDLGLGSLLEEGSTALDRALVAYHAAIGMWRQEGDAMSGVGQMVVGTFSGKLARLEALSDELVERLGPDHPLAADFDDAVTALFSLSRGLGAYEDGRGLDPGTLAGLAAHEAELQSARSLYDRGVHSLLRPPASPAPRPG